MLWEISFALVGLSAILSLALFAFGFFNVNPSRSAPTYFTKQWHLIRLSIILGCLAVVCFIIIEFIEVAEEFLFISLPAGLMSYVIPFIFLFLVCALALNAYVAARMGVMR